MGVPYLGQENNCTEERMEKNDLALGRVGKVQTFLLTVGEI